MGKKQTTSQQWEVLIDFMNGNEEMARGVPAFGSCRKDVDDMWMELSMRLNSAGPPERSVKDWKKIWSDLKVRTKNKIAANKRKSLGTGGGLNTQIALSSIEEAVDVLLSISAVADPEGMVFGLQLPKNAEEQPAPEECCAIVIDPDQSNQKRPSNEKPNPPKKKANFEEESLKLMNKQMEIQKETAMSLNSIAKSNEKIANSLEVLANFFAN